MTYVAQLLPNLQEARILREALVDFTNKPEISPEDLDLTWGLIAKLTQDMRRKEG